MLVPLTSILFVAVFVFGDRVSLSIPGYPGTHSVGQAGLELRDPPISASASECWAATTAQQPFLTAGKARHDIAAGSHLRFP